MTAGLPPLPPLDSLQPDTSRPADDSAEREAVQRFEEAKASGASLGGQCMRGFGPEGHACQNPAAFGSTFCTSCEALSRKGLSDGRPPSELVPCSGPIEAGTGTSSEAAPKPLKLATLAELRKRPVQAVRWLVDLLLPLFGLAILAALPKAGKSTLARWLAHVVCSGGGEWLGRECLGGAVLHLALEESATTVLRHYEKLETPGESLYILDQASPEPALRAGLLEEAIKETKARLVIIDPFARWVRLGAKQGNDYSAVSEAMEPYIQMSRSLDTCMLFVHHSRKAGGRNGEEILGSTAMTASFDTILSMKWTGSQRTVYGFGRDDVQLEDTHLAYDEERGMILPTITTKQAARAAVENRVMEFLDDEAEWTDNKKIKAEVKGRGSEIVAALTRLAEAGLAESRKKAGRGGAIQYRLSELVPCSGPIEAGTGTSSEAGLFGGVQ